MSIEPVEFQSRLRALLGVQGAVVTEEELSRMADSYPQCPGKEHWDVRQYVRPHTGLGAREYRVVRGSSVQDVFRSPERERAAAVGTALNELESQEKASAAHGGNA